MSLRLDEPVTLAAGTGGVERQPPPSAEFFWDLVRIADGRSFALTQGAGDPAALRSNRSILVTFGALPEITQGDYWLAVRMRVPARGERPEVAVRKAIRLRLVEEAVWLAGVAPGVVVAGEEDVVLHGAGFGPAAELRLLASFYDGGCPSCPRSVGELPFRNGTPCRAAVSGDGRTVRFAVPMSLDPGTYHVAVRQGSLILGGPAVRVVPRAIARPAGHDPHRVAWPLVSGQTVEGTFRPAADPTGTFWDYHLYYFYATAGSRLSVFLRRVDASRSWFHPDELDPEIAVETPARYVPQYLHGTDDRPNDDLNASLTRQPVLVTGLYLVVAATSKGAGRYDLGFQLERVPPLRGESRFVMGTGMSGFVTAGQPTIADAFLFDPSGAPFSGAAVLFEPDPNVPPPEFTAGLAGRTSEWGFVTVRFNSAKGGALPALWFAAEQGDAAYSAATYGHDRKGIAVRVRIDPAFWSGLDDPVELDQATGEITLRTVSLKRDPHAPR